MFLLLIACGSRPADPSSGAPTSGAPVDPLEAARTFAASRPIYEQPLGDGTEGVPGLPSLSAETCRACHSELYDEWHTSVHAVAWIDRQFQSEITKSGNTWLCINCHTPLRVQQQVLAVDLVEGDVERPVLVDNPAYDAALRDEGITCAACHVRDGAIHGPGLGGNPPHPVVADPDYRSGALCERCHQATATYPGKNFVCTFDTGNEWRSGPYDEEGRTCVDCHMPTVTRPAALGGPERTVARHWWRGAGIPKVEGRYPPPEANRFGLELAAVVRDGAVEVTATNANAGHMLPTGDPERKVLVTTLFDGEAVHTEVFGQEWTWEPPTKHGDTRLAPRESRVHRVPLREGVKAVVVVARSERMSEENRAYHHLDGYPVDVETHRLEVDTP
ncbi:MAG: multiheme c-type cytochrome [Myxococcota bacterium]